MGPAWRPGRESRIRSVALQSAGGCEERMCTGRSSDSSLVTA